MDHVSDSQLLGLQITLQKTQETSGVEIRNAAEAFAPSLICIEVALFTQRTLL